MKQTSTNGNSIDICTSIILYKYSETRAGDNAVDFLHGFKGYLNVSLDFSFREWCPAL